MPSCCGGAACFCKIVAGSGVAVSGDGSPSNPYEIQASVAMQVQDNKTFDMVLVGGGTQDSPWWLQTQFAATAQLDDLPDVNATNPSDGYVLAFNAASQKWVPAPPTTSAPGLIKHDGTLTGDGSTGAPLKVVGDATRYIRANDPAGVGLTNTGLAYIVQHFADTTARNAIAPAPILNQLSMLDSKPGWVDYWDGGAWTHVGLNQRVIGGEWQQLSGPYVPGMPLTCVFKHVTDTPVNLGGVSSAVNLLFPGDFPAGAAGIVNVQATIYGVPVVMISPYWDGGSGQIRARVRNDAGGDVGQDVSFFVQAWFY